MQNGFHVPSETLDRIRSRSDVFISAAAFLVSTVAAVVGIALAAL